MPLKTETSAGAQCPLRYYMMDVKGRMVVLVHLGARIRVCWNALTGLQAKQELVGLFGSRRCRVGQDRAQEGRYTQFRHPGCCTRWTELEDTTGGPLSQHLKGKAGGCLKHYQHLQVLRARTTAEVTVVMIRTRKVRDQCLTLVLVLGMSNDAGRGGTLHVKLDDFKTRSESDDVCWP